MAIIGKFGALEDSVGVVDSGDHRIDPATKASVEGDATRFEEQSLWLLRRLVKLLESNATVDVMQRQRVAVDNTASVQILSSASLTAPQAQGPTSGAPTGVACYWAPVWVGPVDQRWQIIDAARNTFANGIRSKLIFT